MGYSAQVTVASWATKTAMVLQQINPADDPIPTSNYRDFHQKKQPSSNVFVLMGARHIAGNSMGANMFEYKVRRFERFLVLHSSRFYHSSRLWR